MRIVHTSDWHAGRVWKTVDRLPELAAVLEDLGDFVERERIDLLLMSGDVFDTGAPSAEAERLVFGFFKRVGRTGTRTVVIAGNHDHPTRLRATMLQPGSMIVAQPDVSTPILLRFPFPAWATRPSEAVAAGAARDPFARFPG